LKQNQTIALGRSGKVQERLPRWEPPCPRSEDRAPRGYAFELGAMSLAFLGESFNTHVPRSYVYFAMAFSVSVEMLNITRRRRKPRMREPRDSLQP
jgi:hypothetical protein